jgi:hypothetical protein
MKVVDVENNRTISSMFIASWHGNQCNHIVTSSTWLWPKRKFDNDFSKTIIHSKDKGLPKSNQQGLHIVHQSHR